MSDKTAAYFRAEAEKCRFLARGILDQRTIDTLLLLADDYEQRARAMDQASG